MAIQVQTITGPSYWASALVNGDTSGMTDEEIAAMENWLAIECADGWYIVDVARDDSGEAEESRFTWSYDLYSHTGTRGGDVIDYVAHKQI